MGNEIKKTEKTGKVISLYPSTYELIVKNKGDLQIATFIDSAVKHYIKTIDDTSDLNKIYKEIDEIRDAVRTNLGLSCEVLKQCGVLNGNGEVKWPKTEA
jgi:hypothetical protein